MEPLANCESVMGAYCTWQHIPGLGVMHAVHSVGGLGQPFRQEHQLGRVMLPLYHTYWTLPVAGSQSGISTDFSWTIFLTPVKNVS